jgi:hypothetical protein
LSGAGQASRHVPTAVLYGIQSVESRSEMCNSDRMIPCNTTKLRRFPGSQTALRPLPTVSLLFQA